MMHGDQCECNCQWHDTRRCMCVGYDGIDKVKCSVTWWWWVCVWSMGCWWYDEMRYVTLYVMWCDVCMQPTISTNAFVSLLHVHSWNTHTSYISRSNNVSICEIRSCKQGEMGRPLDDDDDDDDMIWACHITYYIITSYHIISHDITSHLTLHHITSPYIIPLTIYLMLILSIEMVVLIFLHLQHIFVWQHRMNQIDEFHLHVENDRWKNDEQHQRGSSRGKRKEGREGKGRREDGAGTNGRQKRTTTKHEQDGMMEFCKHAHIR